MTVRFGLLGAGRIGKVHARAITANPDARLVAVADAMAPAAEALARQYGPESAPSRRSRPPATSTPWWSAPPPTPMPT